MTSAARNDRMERLPDRPLVDERYPNAGSEYAVLRVDEACEAALVENIKSGWQCVAHGSALYRMGDGSIELQWNYSTDGRFARGHLCISRNGPRGRLPRVDRPALKMAGQKGSYELWIVPIATA